MEMLETDDEDNGNGNSDGGNEQSQSESGEQRPSVDTGTPIIKSEPQPEQPIIIVRPRIDTGTISK